MIDSTATVISIVRDVLLIFVLIFSVVALYVIYRKLSNALDSVDATLKSAREVAEAISDRFSDSTLARASAVSKVFSLLRRRSKSAS